MAEVVAAIGGAVMLVNQAGELWGTVNDLLHSGTGRHNLIVGTSRRYPVTPRAKTTWLQNAWSRNPRF